MAANEADRAKLHNICELSYKAQAIWFLNGFWESHQGEAEKFWAYVIKANSIDIEKHESGSALDELNAHRLLEMFDETLTGMFLCYLFLFSFANFHLLIDHLLLPLFFLKKKKH